jgi:hypothetical protein
MEFFVTFACWVGVHFVGWLFILDTLIKIVLQSWSVYWRRNLNRFDFVFALLLLFLIFAPSSVFGIEPHWYGPLQLIFLF